MRAICFVNNLFDLQIPLIDIVFKKELEKVIANSFVLPNAEQIFREALTQTRASLSSTARDHLYNTTMNNLKLVLNSNGTFSIEIAK